MHEAGQRAQSYLRSHLAHGVGSLLLVDRSRLAANVAAVRAVLGARRLWAVVKADAYGLGAVPVARTLLDAGADALAVARLEEALALREAGIAAPVLIMGPLPEALPDDPDLHVSVTAPDELERAAALPPAVRVHLKLDTGMGRLGLDADPRRWLAAAKALGPRWVGLWSHYANADTPGDPHNDRQQQRFHAALDALAAAGVDLEYVHMANSAGLTRLDPRETGARVGLYLYGADPWDEPTAIDPPRSVAEWIAPLTAARDVPGGWPLSYRGRYVTPGPIRTVALPVGYADGLPTHTDPAVAVWTPHGRRAVRGRITMDLAVVEAGDPAPGEAYVLGPHDHPEGVTIADWAAWTGRIPYEVLTAIGRRVKRVMV